MQLKSFLGRVLIAFGLTAFAATSAMATGKGTITYRITIQNLTAGQAFTPPVVAIHNSRADVFTTGEPANEGVRQIAENGDLGPLVNALSSDPNVRSIYQGSAPLVPANNPGGTGFSDSVTFELETDWWNRRLSFVSMLICTNDGFTGADSVSLPYRKRTLLLRAYETRTEVNTEDFADIVPPCQGLIGVSSDDAGTGASNPSLAETGVVIPHAGVVGDNDLIERVHDWADPVARITIERIGRRY